jgi:hypothetical protein
MNSSPELHGQLARERIERDIAHAVLLRRIQQPSPSIRNAVGHRIIGSGARLAAEPPLEPPWRSLP